MNFQQFTRKMKETICESKILEESIFMGHSILLSEEGLVFIDFKKTQLSSIEEAKEIIEHLILEEQLNQEMLGEVSKIQIADIIREHHDIKVTNDLIESYLDLASSKSFSLDPVITEIRSFATFPINKIDFILNDGSSVAINEETLLKLENIIDDKYQIVDYMRESIDNFMHVIKELN